MTAAPPEDPIALHAAAQDPRGMVPAGFAEKAMASLMQLHGELMEEKERRVQLHRQLMEKEQAVAELRMYVQMLEEKLGSAPASPPSRHANPTREPTGGGVVEGRTGAPGPQRSAPATRGPSAATAPPRAPTQAPRPPAVSGANGGASGRPHPDGWKVW